MRAFQAPADRASGRDLMQGGTRGRCSTTVNREEHRSDDGSNIEPDSELSTNKTIDKLVGLAGLPKTCLAEIKDADTTEPCGVSYRAGTTRFRAVPARTRARRRRIGAYGHVVLIEDNVVGKASVVDELNILTGLDGHLGGDKGKRAIVPAKLDDHCTSWQADSNGGNAGEGDLGDLSRHQARCGAMGLDGDSSESHQ
jgi:hypothetical protein